MKSNHGSKLAIADRICDTTLGLLVLAHVLFILSFVIMLMLAVPQARAADDSCGGEDLLQSFAGENPALLDQMRAEAAKTPNGKGLLWKIEKDGVSPSYLFGTMHLTDSRVIDLAPEARKAFNASKTLVIETTDILDQQASMAAMLSRPDLMMFTDGTTLKSLLSEEETAIVSAALAERGIPLASVNMMRPWLLTAMVSIPACEFARKNGGAPVLDQKLAEDARAAGKPVGGLETAISQLEAMASLPAEFHLKGLVETLKLGDRIDDVFETMIVLYEDGDIGMVWPLFRAILPPDGDNDGGYAAFEKTMVTTRNHGMVKNAEPFLAEGSAFIAVGALHLPGDEGIVSLLRAKGYRVTPAG